MQPRENDHLVEPFFAGLGARQAPPRARRRRPWAALALLAAAVLVGLWFALR